MKFILFFLLILISHASLAKNCATVEGLSEIDQLAALAANIAPQNTCDLYAKAKSKDDLKAVIKNELRQQTIKIQSGAKDRHTVGNTLNHCEPTKDSTTLVLNFEGTGAFEPRTFHIMEKLIKCPKSSSVSQADLKYAYYQSQVEFKNHLNHSSKWSGLQSGPMTEMLTNNKLHEKAKNFDFVSFPSEESELIADPMSMSWKSIKNLPTEMKKSYAGIPKGISNAIKCTIQYYKKAKSLNIKPKFTILTHSSGGRSAVKFLELLKTFQNPLTGKKDLKADLVFTIDPVKEAQHALEEVVSQYAGMAGDAILDSIPFVDVEEHKPVNVWTRKQPNSLYKTSNSKKWINVYQNVDQDGIKMAVKFGIHGSPIHNATENHFITKDLDHGAHGGIAKSPEVLKLLSDQLLSL
ncbi:MAG: hypothetical protein K2P81_14375 [Bacteriovoracaceae bacterium]|nr:hypothetical protein [Bacteriovoracaceae bacterium]